MEARAHVPDRAGRLALARQAGASQRIGRRALDAALQQRLAEAGSAQHRLDGSDVGVLAGVRGGHDRELGIGQVVRLDAACLD